VRPGKHLLADGTQELWIDGAIASVREQIEFSEADWEIFVGVDPNVVVPLRFCDLASFVPASRVGRAAAMNAAAELAMLHADVIAILEDDDRWHPEKTAIQIGHLDSASFVSCSQQLVDCEGRDVPGGVVHYATPSGWLMTAALWNKLGGFDLGYRYLLDMEWLGRLNRLQRRRVHVTSNHIKAGYGLVEVGYYAAVATYNNPEFLVKRLVNPCGSMASVQEDASAAAIAKDEERRIIKAFGAKPW
jgi:glycosyltransferase involved in cell wall biosynthesis